MPGRKSAYCPLCVGMELNPAFYFAHKLERCRAGTVLYEHNQRLDGVYIICEGSVASFLIDIQGRTEIIMRYGKQAVLGAENVLDNSYASEGVKCIEDCEFIFIPRKSLLDALHKKPELGLNLAQILSHQAREIRSKLIAKSAMNARERVAQYFLGVATEGESVQLKQKKQEIASELSITPETFSRITREMVGQGLIGMNGRFVKINDSIDLAEFGGRKA